MTATHNLKDVPATPHEPPLLRSSTGGACRAAPDLSRIAWLTAWALARKGLPVRLRLLGAPGADIPAPAAARVTVFLRRPIPISQLVYAIRHTLDQRAPATILVSSDPAHYNEHLHLDDATGAVRIERLFRPHGHAQGTASFLGVICRTADAARCGAPADGHAIAVARGLADRGRAVATLQVAVPPRHETFDARSDIVASLSSRALAALAGELGFAAHAPDIYAAPGVGIDAAATLRGPLLIDAAPAAPPALAWAIGPHHIHVGPGWIDGRSPAVTIADERRGSGVSIPYFVGPATRRRPVYETAKRAFDVSFALFVLAITLPITVVVALIVKLTDLGPIFFVHTREGLNGRPFGCIKFRTMVLNAEAMKEKLRQANQVDGPQFKIAHDPRITRIGRFLRKTNVDELPQFLNVLLGQMSVVGPRPSPFKENQLCPPWREARLSVKPGITGLWQVSRSRDRGAADFQEWIYYDTQYVERRGFWLDIKIILLTIKEILGKGQ